MADEEQDRQTNRLRRGFRKLHAAVILSRCLSLPDEAFQITILFVVLDAQIDAKDGGEAQITRESVLLVRQDDTWCIKSSALKSRMVRD